MGYEIKQGKYISFRAAGQERFTRAKTLGAAYTEEAIKERIKGVYAAKTKTLREDKKIRLVVDLENSIKAQSSLISILLPARRAVIAAGTGSAARPGPPP